MFTSYSFALVFFELSEIVIHKLRFYSMPITISQELRRICIESQTLSTSQYTTQYNLAAISKPAVSAGVVKVNACTIVAIHKIG